ncbi:MAG: hypothetical protein OXN94_18040 [Chloroflexota bacterium]|nr:hypothetical protein [Chloroflexota bacterium]
MTDPKKKSTNESAWMGCISRVVSILFGISVVFLASCSQENYHRGNASSDNKTAEARRVELTKPARKVTEQTAEHIRYSSNRVFKRRIDAEIKGHTEAFAGSLCGVISQNRNCRKRPKFAEVANCVIRQAFFDSASLAEAINKANDLFAKSIPTLLKVEAFVNGGGLDKPRQNLTASERKLVDSLTPLEQCFYSIEA